MIILFDKGNKRSIDETHREIEEEPNEERLDSKDHEEFREYKEYTDARDYSKEILSILSEFRSSSDLSKENDRTDHDHDIESDQKNLENIVQSERIIGIEKGLLTREGKTIFHFSSRYEVKDQVKPFEGERIDLFVRDSRESGDSRIKRRRSFRRGYRERVSKGKTFRLRILRRKQEIN